ncbi:MAG: response regulator [Desulfatitalea sp.]|nr:response regulator [Desulfatitalea sp.]MBI5895727.1 response regulator [Desulfobacterales bacterium]
MNAQAKILVVEDDTNVATVLEARLESFGHDVCDIARSGPAAVRGAVQHQPDLVLMDILLEGDMNGVEAAELIRSQVDVPVVFITCLSDQAMLDRAVKANAYGYILKPYDNAELRYTIEIALVKYQAAKERENLIGQLEKALAEVKRLSGLLPICASCKKIRDEHNTWQPIEQYIHTHSEADFSHGICPECAATLYPDFYPRSVK